MSSEATNTSSKKFYQVLNGEFRTRVDESHPEAVSRINKNNVQVFEKPVRAVFGRIEGIEIVDGNFGKQILITLDKNEGGENPVLSFIAESKDGRDVMKKLPAIDFSKEVKIAPYRFTPADKDEEISGISISHQDSEGQFTQKVGNFYFDPIKKVYINGYPSIDWDNSSESEQKIYKIQRDEFLLNETKKVIEKSFSEKEVKAFNYPKNELTEEEIAGIPF